MASDDNSLAEGAFYWVNRKLKRYPLRPSPSLVDPSSSPLLAWGRNRVGFCSQIRIRRVMTTYLTEYLEQFIPCGLIS